MVGPGHCPMISKYGPPHSKEVGPVDPSFFSCEKILLSSYSESTNSTKQKMHVGNVNTVKPVLSGHSSNDKTSILKTSGS